MKKIYKMLWLLALLAVMPVANVVAQSVAKIGSTEYATLEAAVAAATTGQTITLLADVDLSSHARSASDDIILEGVTLDLNRKTIRGFNSGVRYSGNNAVIKNGTFDFVAAEPRPNYGLSIGSYTDGATVSDNMVLEDLTVVGGINIDLANVTLNNVNIDMNQSTFYAIWVDEDGSNATFNSGTINAGSDATAVFGVAKTNASLKIAGGTINTNGEKFRLEGGYMPVEVSGGVFDTQVPEDCCAAGFIPQDNGNGTYGVKEGAFVAQIGTAKYETLAEAIAAVPTDGSETTITMIADEAISGNGVTIAAGQNVVLDLNGKTISQTGPMTGTSWLIKNQGTLTIKDNTDTNKNGTGTGKMTSTAENPDTGEMPSYATNLISNYGVLNIESGYFQVLTNEGYASYVVDNYSGGTANISGGKLTNTAARTYVVRMFLNSTTANNALNISGTAVITGSYAVWMQYANAKANKASLNISGGTIEATQGYAVYAGSAGGNSRNATNISVSITGGDIEGTGAWFGTDTAFESFSVTGGTFANFGVGAAGGNGLVSGGTFKSISLFTQTRDDSTPLLADGYEVEDNGNGAYEVVHITEYVINDGDAYTFTSDVTGVTATYKRSFGSDRVKKYQGWFVPFDYTITAADLQKFKFFQINMIAHSATEGSTETTDPNKLWIHLIPMAENGVLKANTPYIFTPQEEATDYEFTTTNATLKALTTGSVASCSTMTEEFNFYGVYSSVHPEDASDIFYYMAKSGQISRATKTSTTVGANRWIFRVTPKDGSQSSVSYSIGFVVNGVEDDDVTAVSSATVEAEGEVVGYYTLNGQKVSEPTKGVYVVKYANGTSKKVVF